MKTTLVFALVVVMLVGVAVAFPQTSQMEMGRSHESESDMGRMRMARGGDKGHHDDGHHGGYAYPYYPYYYPYGYGYYY